jgi:hypothetical protein
VFFFWEEWRSGSSFAFPYTFIHHLLHSAVLWMSNSCLMVESHVLNSLCGGTPLEYLCMPTDNSGFAVVQPITTPTLSQPFSWLPALQWPLVAKHFGVVPSLLSAEHKDKISNCSMFAICEWRAMIFVW